jgi:hypothetical protein
MSYPPGGAWVPEWRQLRAVEYYAGSSNEQNLAQSPTIADEAAMRRLAAQLHQGWEAGGATSDGSTANAVKTKTGPSTDVVDVGVTAMVQVQNWTAEVGTRAVPLKSDEPSLGVSEARRQEASCFKPSPHLPHVNPPWKQSWRLNESTVVIATRTARSRLPPSAAGRS